MKFIIRNTDFRVVGFAQSINDAIAAHPAVLERIDLWGPPLSHPHSRSTVGLAWADGATAIADSAFSPDEMRLLIRNEVGAEFVKLIKEH